jgi:molybdopterin synthase sulfur carrier subunit
MVRIAYFSWVRDRMGVPEETVALTPDVTTIGALVHWLTARDAPGAAAFAEPDHIRAAVDGMMVGFDAPIGAAREIALFPPVTGG